MTKITPFLKKHIMPNLPYALIFWFACKIGEAYRLAVGYDFLQRLTRSMGTLHIAMSRPLPSLNPFDWLVGLSGAGLIYVIVWNKKKNAKKFRKDVEYGSARWSA